MTTKLRIIDDNMKNKEITNRYLIYDEPTININYRGNKHANYHS